MKKVLMIFTVLLHGAISAQESPQDNNNFQIDKGIWSIEGDISLYFTNSESFQNDHIENTGFGFGIAPKVGYAINNNLILGLGVGYDHRTSESQRDDYPESSEMTINQYSIFPYVKKYFPLGKKLALHVQGEAKYFKYIQSVKDNPTSDNDRQELFIGFRPGVSFQLSNNFLMHANIGALGYSSYKNTIGDQDSSKGSSFRLNLDSNQLYFGLVWLI